MQKGKKLVAVWFSIMFLALLVAGSAQAIPEFINYQGLLTDPGGTPVNATVNMTFRLYDTDIGGASLWEETQSVTLVDGLYTVQLGKTTTLATLSFDNPYWLTVEVATDGEMTPRQALDSTPYAVTAGMAESVEWANINNIPTDLTDGDDDTIYSGGFGLDLVGTTFSANTTALQARVNGSCSPGMYISSIDETGVPTCSPDNDTQYTAGFGLDLTGTTFSADTLEVQARITGACTAGSYIRGIDEAGSVICDPDTDSQVTSVDGLSGGTITSATTVTGSLTADSFDATGSVTGNDFKFGSLNAIEQGPGNGLHVGPYTGLFSTGSYNTFMGYNAGRSNTTGMNNTFIGYGTGYENLTGKHNLYVGRSAGTSSDADYNTFLGHYAGMTNTSGYSNTFVGNNSGADNIDGNLNTFVGSAAGRYNTSGMYNSFLGYTSCANNTTGSNNVCLGRNTGPNNTTGSGNLFIGYSAGPTFNVSNRLYIDNITTDTPLIFGDFLADYLRINGDLDVAGDMTTGSLDVLGPIFGDGSFIYNIDFFSLVNVPVDLLDGDDVGITVETDPTVNSMAKEPALNTCNTGQVPEWNGVNWICADNPDTDTQLSEATVENYVTNGPIDLAAGSTVAGDSISTAVHDHNTDYVNVTGDTMTNGLTIYSNSRTVNLGNVNEGIYAHSPGGVFGAGKSAIYGYRFGGSEATEGGTGWGATVVDSAVKGYSYFGNSFTAGLAGYNYLDYNESAGVIGANSDASLAGILAYKDVSGNLWGLFTPNNAYVGGMLTAGSVAAIGGVQATNLSASSTVFTTDVNATGNISVDGDLTVAGKVNPLTVSAAGIVSLVSLTPTRASAFSQSITVPDSGYIIANFSGMASCNDNPAWRAARYYLSDVADAISGFTTRVYMSSTNIGSLAVPVSLTGRFPVAGPGTYTVHLNAYYENVPSCASLFNPVIVLMYSPY